MPTGPRRAAVSGAASPLPAGAQRGNPGGATSWETQWTSDLLNGDRHFATRVHRDPRSTRICCSRPPRLRPLSPLLDFEKPVKPTSGALRALVRRRGEGACGRLPQGVRDFWSSRSPSRPRAAPAARPVTRSTRPRCLPGARPPSRSATSAPAGRARAGAASERRCEARPATSRRRVAVGAENAEALALAERVRWCRRRFGPWRQRCDVIASNRPRGRGDAGASPPARTSRVRRSYARAEALSPGTPPKRAGTSGPAAARARAAPPRRTT